MSDEPRPNEEPDATDETVSADPAPDRSTEGASDRLEEVLAEHRDAPEEAGPDQPETFDPFAPLPESGQQDDADDALPDAPLFALLRTLAEEITPPRIDRVWIFPPRRIETGETAVVVVAAFPATDDGRRRVYAAHYTALDDSDQHRLAVDEYGTAPEDRVGRLVEETVERIKEGPTDAPRSIKIQGSERAWDEMLHELAEKHLEARQQRRGIRR